MLTSMLVSFLLVSLLRSYYHLLIDVEHVLIGMQVYRVIKIIARLVIYHALSGTSMKNVKGLPAYISLTSMFIIVRG